MSYFEYWKIRYQRYFVAASPNTSALCLYFQTRHDLPKESKWIVSNILLSGGLWSAADHDSLWPAFARSLWSRMLRAVLAPLAWLHRCHRALQRMPDAGQDAIRGTWRNTTSTDFWKVHRIEASTRHWLRSSWNSLHVRPAVGHERPWNVDAFPWEEEHAPDGHDKQQREDVPLRSTRFPFRVRTDPWWDSAELRITSSSDLFALRW